MKPFVVVALSTALLSAQPVIKPAGIANAASYGKDIAQGSLFVVFGSGLGPDRLMQASSLPLGSTLGGSSVMISAGGQSFPAPVVYVSAGQLAAVLPSNIPAGQATLAVSYNGQTSAPATFNIVRSSFGAFTNNSLGSGPAVVQNFVSQAEQTRNSLSESASPGQVVTLWGTGLGPIASPDSGTPPVGDLNNDVSVMVGGQPAHVLYKGRSGCCAAIDQIVFEVPSGVEGCYAPLSVAVNGVASPQTITMSVSPRGRACTDPGLVTSDDLDKARAQGSLRLGTLLLTSYTLDDKTYFDYGLLAFSRAHYDQLVQTVQHIAAAAPGTCEAYGWDGEKFTTVGGTGALGADFFDDYLFWSPDLPLDAGSTVSMTSGAKSVRFDQLAPGYYVNYFLDTSQGGQAGAYIDPGAYQVSNGTGGKDVPPFQATVVIADRLRFSGNLPAAIPRSNNLVVNWTGGSQDDRVLIYGASWDQAGLKGGAFTCVQRGGAKQFTIPSSVLSVLPASGSVQTGQGGGAILLYGLSPFQRTSISGLDAFYAARLNLVYRLAQFQ